MSDAGGPSVEELLATIDQQGKLLEEAGLTISSQAELIDELRRLIAQLEKRLGKNSSNSSLPPSSDRFQKPAKAESPNRKARRALGRKPGKQPGAEGKHLPTTDTPDVVVELAAPEHCSDCGEDLASGEDLGEEVRQVVDVPKPVVEVTEYRVHKVRCRCGKLNCATFPPEAKAPACYGANLRCMVVYPELAHEFLGFGLAGC